VKIVHDGGELQFKPTYLKPTLKSGFRRNSSFSNMEMFFKSLNEEDLDYIKHVRS
jgi:hypothetical protein